MARTEVVDPTQPAVRQAKKAPMSRRQRRAAEARERLAREIKRRAHTLSEFCFANGFSRAHYYNLKAKGLAPDEFRALGKILITDEAERKWRKRIAAAQSV